jgi:hypothetical protein
VALQQFFYICNITDNNNYTRLLSEVDQKFPKLLHHPVHKVKYSVLSFKRASEQEREKSQKAKGEKFIQKTVIGQNLSIFYYLICKEQNC